MDCNFRLSVLLAAAALTTTARSAAPPSLTMLRDDPRLAVQINCAEVDQPLPAALKALERDLKLTLAATPTAADCRVTILIRDRPAGKLLDDLAAHLELEWRRTSRGYELIQSPRARQTQEAERRAARDDDWRRTREWVGRVGRVAGLPPVALKARAGELANRLREPSLPAAERQLLLEEQAAVKEAQQPGVAVAVGVLGALTAGQVERLRSGGDLLLDADDLPPRVAEQVRTIRSDNLPFQNPEQIPVWADVLVQYRDWGIREGRPKRGELRHALSMELVEKRERDGKQEWTAIHWQPSPPPHETAPTNDATGDVELKRLVELKIPERRRLALDRLGGAETAFTWESRLWPAWPTLGEISELLHRETGLEVMAESFTRARVDPAWVRGRQPVGVLLDRLAYELGYSWRKDGRLVRCSSRTPGRDRALEAPERIVRPWRERAARRGFAGLDEAAELASRLTDDQALGVSSYWGWYFEDPWIAPLSNLYAERRHLRLWAALNPAQRAVALSGMATPVARMSSEQGRAFVTALQEPARSPWGAGAEFRRKHPEVSLDEVRGGGLSVKAEQAWLQQLYVGTRADGSQVRILARRPAYRPANLGNLPNEFQWSPLGRETPLDTFTFNYHLAGREKPARSVELEVLRSPSEAP